MKYLICFTFLATNPTHVKTQTHDMFDLGDFPPLPGNGIAPLNLDAYRPSLPHEASRKFLKLSLTRLKRIQILFSYELIGGLDAVVTELLDRDGVNVNIRDGNGRTALIAASPRTFLNLSK